MSQEDEELPPEVLAVKEQLLRLRGVASVDFDISDFGLREKGDQGLTIGGEGGSRPL